jgi:hypothetical protein
VAVVGGVTLGLFYAVLKLTKWSLNADETGIGASYIDHLSDLYRTALLVIVVLVFGHELGRWLLDAYDVLTGALP